MKKLSVILFGWMMAFAVWAAPVNVNQANADEIAAALTGVGKVKAEAIVAYREAHGHFKSVESLSQVKGIGDKTVEKNKADILLK
ncbi:competence protein ComEA [Hydrogenovibrio sp. SC-1]|uniref:ComEA family DNA-binding protein n=1 Tax=Hydrogenovibrio sp. SC-1 TaxID=2065820 RepID=UPI000C7DEC22|nr:helix-hairpin-helix domain-containing protein [Hydrogenovibrio sp. SC-1]PLA75403.1 competence protein ComEA [Hydrogenovibrio sp. SC-1]